MPPLARLAALLPLVACLAAEPPAITAAGHFEVKGQRVPVAEVLARLDADGDGGLSRGELQQGTWSRLVSEVAGGLASGAASAERGLSQLFERFDGDASGSLDAREVAAAAAAVQAAQTGGADSEERQRQMLRARAAAPAPEAAAARRLDKVKELADDPRCHAPRGFPNAPEGWVCVDEKEPLYCTNKKRAYDIEPCTWRGACQAGQWLEGGCRYPLCEASGGVESCFNASHSFWCSQVQAHGRQEAQPRVRRICGSSSSCRVFDDGVPPTRRRRTTTCHEECHKKRCEQVCADDPPDPPVTTCVRHGCNLLSVAEPQYVRSCVSMPSDEEGVELPRSFFS
mmetsp:Transcript_98006/g.260381  ORF Transcript_98006/g.260381 Transcript_98006/m.260381 type:complete len:341 (-) Transcript_98006:65-1087(-)